MYLVWFQYLDAAVLVWVPVLFGLARDEDAEGLAEEGAEKRVQRRLATLHEGVELLEERLVPGDLLVDLGGYSVL